MRDLGRGMQRMLPRGRVDGLATPSRVAVPVLSTAVFALTTALVTVLLELPGWVVCACVASALTISAAVAHRLLGNIAAGITLKLARPYDTAERVRIEAPEVGRTVDAQVVRLGLVNSTLASWSGMFLVPNSRLLRITPRSAGGTGDSAAVSGEKSMQA